MSQYNSLYCDRGKARTVLQYSHCAHDTARAWALGRRWACRWALGERACWACARLGVLGAGAAGAGAAGAQGERGAERWWASGRASGRRGRARQAAAGARLGGRALGAGQTGLWAQVRGACAAGAGSVRGFGRQGPRLGAPGVLAGPVGGSCT